MSDIGTDYLGLRLRSPIVASAGPPTGQPETAAKLDDAGVGAVVLPSLFEEEVLHEQADLNLALEAGAEHFAEALGYFPALTRFETAADRYLALVESVKRRVGVPVIASLNATSAGGWERYAALLEQAGADALELNLYRMAADPDWTAEQVEAADLRPVADVRAAVGIPLAVKLAPYYSAFANFAHRVVDAGAGGLVLFNRFYQPDVDVERREAVPSLELSRRWELRLPLRWIAVLRAQLGDQVSLAATSGVHTGEDVAKAVLVGANVAMTTSALLRQGPAHVQVMETELRAWMERLGCESLSEVAGSMSYRTTDDPAAFERANYVRALHAWTAPHRLTPRSPTGRPDLGYAEPSS